MSTWTMPHKLMVHRAQTDEMGWNLSTPAGEEIFLSDEMMDWLVQFMQAPATENDERYGVEVPA